MAVEDHPQFEKWAEALKNYKAADEVYKEAVSRKINPKWIAHAKGLRDMAQEKYDRISRELDNDV